ncbi:MAG: RNA helicase, partial [Rubrivivax sp.]|nr:RNA helicase [Rubrivivax sp.]
EKRDFGMIQRIQRFTTQRMPVATITGLEPKRAEPKPLTPRPGFGVGKPAGKTFGPRPFGAKPFKPAGKSFAKKPGPRPER